GEYVTALHRGERPLIVAQTWNEVHAVNDAVRATLRETGELESGTTLLTFQPVDRGEAEKRDPRYYEAGQSVVFLKSYGRFAKGEACEIESADENGVRIVRDGRVSRVTFRYADRFAVVRKTEMEIAPGDRLQIKANYRTAEGARLHNGELVTVKRIEDGGTVVVMDERGAIKTLTPSQRLLVRGYAVTSYASQGKTVDTVIVADSGSRVATSAQQWYVGISRARKNVVVLTPNKAALRENIQRSGERQLAVREKPPVRKVVEQMRLGARQRIQRAIELNRRHEFIRQRIAQQQTQRRGMRI
ncbi:MAG TPA: conjugal transfer protein, partial [Opitutaceae bacterium]|nr:conjugal transfer protein [Opitutaceae bacterium]